MNNNPQITFWINDTSVNYPIIEPSGIKREWLDKTYNKVGYFCSPLNSATSHGWEIKLPQDVVVRWDGISEGIDGEDRSHIQIISGEYYNGVKLASNEAGVGQVSFFFNAIVETDKDHYIIMTGPPNYLFPDAEPLTTLWRSDSFAYNELLTAWKITTANKDIIFPKGMPIGFIVIHPKNLLESTEVFVKKMDLDRKENIKQYAQARSNHFEEFGQYDFPQFYKKGIGPDGKKQWDGQSRTTLKKVNIE